MLGFQLNGKYPRMTIAEKIEAAGFSSVGEYCTACAYVADTIAGMHPDDVGFTLEEYRDYITLLLACAAKPLITVLPPNLKIVSDDTPT